MTLPSSPTMSNTVFRKLSKGANSFRRHSRIFSDKDVKNATADSKPVNGTTNGASNGALNGHDSHVSRTVASIPEEPAPSAAEPVKSTPVDPIPEEEVHVNGVPLTQVLKDLGKQIKGGFDHSTLVALIDMIRHKEGMDDRKLLLEHALTIISRLPHDSSLSLELQNKVIALLYNDLSHPPATYVGNEYKFRAADGSNNNILAPDMGKAGTPYSRSVQQIHPLPTKDLPDAGLVFDTLLQREKFVKHPGGLSSLMFGFAALVIHTYVFRTSHTDGNINETSSYVDLAPLYGNNQNEQDRVRKHDGYGLMHNDVFAENRLLLLPPACSVLLVLFCRNHNFIAKKLFEINERGTFVDPSTLAPERLSAQDEEIFQTARLINCGWFGSIVFSDYFSCILGLVRTGSNWSLSPFGDFRTADHATFERGKGNVCSVEFNCLYRWHATTSQKNEKWVERLMSDIFKGKPFAEVTAEDFKAVGQRLHSMDQDLTHWTFGNLTRGEDGTFDDEKLANILHDATDDPAAAFGARGTPVAMRLHEVMGIEQNRQWGTCSMNEFRKFLGLKTYSSFLEWNSNPDVAHAAEKLYGHIDNLELYVGLQAEDAKPLVDGAGLCPGYTVSRAILSDAIALTRGDRFFTQDYTPANLTTWGFEDCQRDPNAFGFGSALGKLFLRTLPKEFGEEGNSVYAFFPLMTPGSMKVHLEKMGQADKYDFTRPMKKVMITGDEAQRRIVKRGAAVLDLGGRGFYPIQKDEKRRNIVIGALVKLIGSEDRVGEYFFSHTTSLIKLNSFAVVGGKQRVVDVVRDVFKMLTMVWAADVGGITLKTNDAPHGMYTAYELFDILGDLYEYVFMNVDQARLMLLKEKVSADVKKLAQHIKSSVAANSWFPNLSIFGRKKENDDVDEKQFAKRLSEVGVPADEMVNTILAIMVGASVELSLAMTNALDWAFERKVVIDKSDAVNKQLKDALHTGSGRPFEWGHGVSKCLGDELTIKILAETLRAVFSLPGMCRGPGNSGALNRFLVEHEELQYGYLDKEGKLTPWPSSMMVKYNAQ
ncbi:heme peroxidase [Hymenopellis radicata]|nr:heme peroxidase [Hymenopellis radicata]